MIIGKYMGVANTARNSTGSMLTALMIDQVVIVKGIGQEKTIAEAMGVQ